MNTKELRAMLEKATVGDLGHGTCKWFGKCPEIADSISSAIRAAARE